MLVYIGRVNVCMYTHVLVHVEARGQPQASFFLKCHPPWACFVFEKEFLTGNVTSEPHKSTSLHFPRAGVTSVCHHACPALRMVLGIKWGPHACTTSSL